MTIEEAIVHCEEVAKECEGKGYCDRNVCAILDANGKTCDECEAEKCRTCAKDHRQLAEWLKELKALREVLNAWKIEEQKKEHK